MMDDNLLIKVEGVSKKFCKSLKRSLLYGVGDISRSIFGISGSNSLRKDEFWAIRNVSFEVRRGECLGLIGHNGAGKSTLLKMLNGLIRPDEGRIEMRGKVGALIELGAGFNPVLTGRENVYNNGAVLGFSKAEIDKKFDEIISFSEIEEFIDMPVQNYSSGMKVRLGFAIAAHMEPDILLIDEVLAVGDMRFVIKCFNRMDELLQNTAVILVSHSIPQVARMATKLLFIDKGVSKYYSNDVSFGITEYYKQVSSKISNFKSKNETCINNIRLKYRNKYYLSNEEIVIDHGDDFELEIELYTNVKLSSPELYLVFYDKEQRGFAEVFNFQNQIQIQEKMPGKIKFEVKFSNVFFSQGKYSISIGLTEVKNDVKRIVFREQSLIYFTINGGIHGWTPLQVYPQWNLIENI